MVVAARMPVIQRRMVIPPRSSCDWLPLRRVYTRAGRVWQPPAWGAVSLPWEPLGSKLGLPMPHNEPGAKTAWPPFTRTCWGRRLLLELLSGPSFFFLVLPPTRPLPTLPTRCPTRRWVRPAINSWRASVAPTGGQGDSTPGGRSRRGGLRACLSASHQAVPAPSV